MLADLAPGQLGRGDLDAPGPGGPDDLDRWPPAGATSTWTQVPGAGSTFSTALAAAFTTATLAIPPSCSSTYSVRPSGVRVTDSAPPLPTLIRASRLLPRRLISSSRPPRSIAYSVACRVSGTSDTTSGGTVTVPVTRPSPLTIITRAWAGPPPSARRTCRCLGSSGHLHGLHREPDHPGHLLGRGVDQLQRPGAAGGQGQRDDSGARFGHRAGEVTDRVAC